MNSSHLPADSVELVQRTVASRAAVMAFFKYCEQTKRLQQQPPPPPSDKPKKRLLH